MTTTVQKRQTDHTKDALRYDVAKTHMQRQCARNDHASAISVRARACVYVNLQMTYVYESTVYEMILFMK